uniref:Snurportin-1 n=1 Tax=Angiostrongylus cantonensis TaxID=6313 RepID=A0A0K0CVL5_ANGCA
MEDIDSLVGELSETHVDSATLGEHPRFSRYKNAGKAAEQQAQRRRDAMERQRNSRFDHFNHTRMLAENEAYEEGDEQTTTHCFRYADVLMLSEWLVDIPEQLSSEWMMVPSPVGKRVLVVAAKGTTTAYNKGGKAVTQFRSRLPGGSFKINFHAEVYTILDCILDSKKTFYCLDVLAWNGMDMSANPFDFRQFMLSSRLQELSEVAVATKKFPLVIFSNINGIFSFELDGLLYYHTGVVYEAGQSPLVGWLKPWMLPEILNVTTFDNSYSLQFSIAKSVILTEDRRVFIITSFT